MKRFVIDNIHIVVTVLVIISVTALVKSFKGNNNAEKLKSEKQPEVSTGKEEAA
jgi:hypothetical protein